jgi:hypothetical protein
LIEADGTAVDLSSVTRMTLDFDGTVIDSAIRPDAFGWTHDTTGKATFALGAEDIP